MKNIKLKLFVLVFGLSLVSCEDAIDIVQAGELYPETAFQSVEDLETGLYGVYASVPAEGGIYFTSVFTDETAIGVGNGGQGVEYMSHLLTSNASPGGIWTGNYRAINLANRIIEAGNNLSETIEEDEQEALNHIIAQAYALRALCHLQLLTYYAPDMKDNSSLGVIKLDFIPGINDFLPRNTVGEVAELINADLEFAQANFSEELQSDTPGFIRKSFFDALRARMAVYRGNFAQAGVYANNVITSSGLNLANAVTYPTIWLDLSNEEVIFKLIRNATSVSGANFYNVWSSSNATPCGNPYLEVNRALFNLVDIPTDSRRGVLTYVLPGGDCPAAISDDYTGLSLSEYRAQDILPVNKYPTSKGIALLGDIKVFRLSEMYLIRAESKVATDLTGAAADVFAVRVARNPAATMPTYANQQEAWADILKERRVELAFEGHRYVDLKRLGNLAGVQLDRDPRDSSEQDFPQTLSNNDYRFTLPIPMSEIRVNPNIRSQQNPGYND